MLLLFFCLCSFIPIFGQESNTSISVNQDIRLLLVGDDRGNGKFTPDILIRLEFEAFKLQKSSIPLYIGIEYSDLNSSTLIRFMLGVGFVTKFSFSDKFLFGVYLDHGLLGRGKSSFLKEDNMDESTFMSFSLSFETSYPISEKIRLSIMYQLLDRADLSTRFGGNNINGSAFLGVKFAL